MPNEECSSEVVTSTSGSPTESPAQLVSYLDHLNLPEGWMAIFDDDESKSWDEKIYTRDEVMDGKTIHFIGL